MTTSRAHAASDLVTSIMRTELLTAPPDAPLATIVKVLKHVGCVPIIDDLGRPLGIITKLDILETLGEERATAREVMMPFAFTLQLGDTVASAAAMMSHERIHHVFVVDGARKLVGLVSSLDLADWIAKREPARHSQTAQ